MTNYIPIYERLQEYYKLFSNNIESGFILDEDYYYGMPIRRVHELTKIPLDVIRKDIIGIRSWKYILDLDDDIDESLSNELTAVLDLDDDSEFNAKLLEGYFDEVPIFLSENKNGQYYIKLTSDEAYAYHHYQKQDNYAPFHFASYHIKDSYRYNYIDNLSEKLELLNEAINRDAGVEIVYSPARTTDFSATIKPLKIIYDSMDNMYAVVTIVEQQVYVYRLDRIKSIKKSRHKTDISETHLLDIAPNVWGFEFSSTPHIVKVRFYNEGKVWSKVRKDLSCRTNGKLYEKNGFLYYEDTVYGINSFRTWIYGYGSSAIVEEPLELREQIIESLKLRLRNSLYET